MIFVTLLMIFAAMCKKTSILPRFLHYAKSSEAIKLGAAICVLAISLILRWKYYSFRSWDYSVFLTNWYDYIHDHNGIFAFKHTFANYNVPYLYLLAVGGYMHLGPLLTVKIVGSICDLGIAFYAYKIVSISDPKPEKQKSWKAIGAFCSFLILPTIFINSALWGQSDGIYTCFLFAGVYYCIKQRYYLSGILFGIAISVKLQAVFIIPALLLWILLKKFPIAALLLIPVTYCVFFLPILLLHGDFQNFFTVYLRQASGNHILNISAASFWALFPYSHKTVLWTISLLVLTVIICIFLVISYRKITFLSPILIIATATVSVFLVPFFGPSMHERYAFSADCFLLLCFWAIDKRFIIPAVLTESASLFTYLPLLQDTSPDLEIFRTPEYRQMALSPNVSNEPFDAGYFSHPLLTYPGVGLLNLLSYILLSTLYWKMLNKESLE